MDASSFLHHVRNSSIVSYRHRGRSSLRRRAAGPVCTAQPHQSQGSSDFGTSTATSSGVNSPAVAVQEADTRDVVTTDNFSDLDASNPLAEQLAGQIVVVSAATSSTGVLNVAGTAPGGNSSVAPPASPTLPEGLPSPATVDASLSTGFGR